MKCHRCVVWKNVLAIFAGVCSSMWWVLSRSEWCRCCSRSRTSRWSRWGRRRPGGWRATRRGWRWAAWRRSTSGRLLSDWRWRRATRPGRSLSRDDSLQEDGQHGHREDDNELLRHLSITNVRVAVCSPLGPIRITIKTKFRWLHY